MADVEDKDSFPCCLGIGLELPVSKLRDEADADLVGV